MKDGNRIKPFIVSLYPVIAVFLCWWGANANSAREAAPEHGSLHIKSLSVARDSFNPTMSC